MAASRLLSSVLHLSVWLASSCALLLPPLGLAVDTRYTLVHIIAGTEYLMYL